MDHYSDKLRAYLDQNPMHYTDGNSLLEELYWCYTEANTFDSKELWELFHTLHCKLPELSGDRFDEIFSTVTAISVQLEKTAFQAGTKIGLRLACELIGK